MTDKPEQFQLKWKAVAVVMIMVCASVLMTAHAMGSGNGGNSIPVIIESGSGVETASYIIYKDGDYTCAKNGTSGRIELRNQNASLVISSVLGSGTVYIGPGEYEIDYPIDVVNNTAIIGNGAVLTTAADDVKIFATRSVDNSDYAAMTPIPLAQNLYIGQNTVYISDTSQFSSGDYIYLMSDAHWMGVYTRTHASPAFTGDGEIRRIASVSAASMVLYDGVVSDYLSSYNASVYPVDMMNNVSFSGLTLIGKGKTTTNVGIELTQVSNINIDSCIFINLGHAAINLYDVIDGVINNVDITGSRLSGLGYGIAVARATSNLVVTNSRISDCTHGMSTGQTSYGLPNYVTFKNVVFDCNVRQHPAGIYQTFDNCVFNYSLAIENPHTIVSNSIIRSVSSSASGVYIGGGGDHYANPHNTTIKDCHILVRGNLHAVFVTNGVNLTIQNCVIEQQNWTSGDGIFAICMDSSLNSNPYSKLQYIDIADNNIYSSRKGIGVYRSAVGISIHGNEIRTASDSIVAPLNYTLKNVEIVENTIISGRYAINIINADELLISENNILGTHGLFCPTAIITDAVVSNNYFYTTSADGALYFSGGSGKLIKDIVITGNIISTTSSRGVRIITANNITVADNIISALTGQPVIVATSSDVKVNGNTLYASSIANQVSITTCYRVVINGVGSNGENDPASAGEWKGFGYEGLFVKWNAGATHYLSVYRGGAWYDMTLA